MDEKIEPFVCRNCGRVVDPRKRFCSFECEANYEEERTFYARRLKGAMAIEEENENP